MKIDIGRVSFDPTKHFSRVLLQQGRVQLESDANEQTAILLETVRALAADLVGPWGGTPGAFVLAPAADSGRDVTIGAGAYYVQGVRVENDGVGRDPQEPLTFRNQPWYPAPGGLTAPEFGDEGYLLYLDVWERLVTQAEDLDLVEAALDGLDTAARAQVVWQVRAVAVPDADLTGVTCASMPGAWPGQIL